MVGVFESNYTMVKICGHRLPPQRPRALPCSLLVVYMLGTCVQYPHGGAGTGSLMSGGPPDLKTCRTVRWAHAELSARAAVCPLQRSLSSHFTATMHVPRVMHSAFVLLRSRAADRLWTAQEAIVSSALGRA